MATGFIDRGRHRRKLTILGISSLLLVAMVVVSVFIGVKINRELKSKQGEQQVSASMRTIESICQPTDYKETCIRSLSSASHGTDDPMKLIKGSFEASIEELNHVADNFTLLLLKDLQKEPRTKKAVEDCKELFNDAIYDFRRSINEIGVLDFHRIDKMLTNLKVWLSATITYQETCLDGFENTTADASNKVRKLLETSMQMSSNSLAIICEMSSAFGNLQTQSATTQRRLLADHGLDRILKNQRLHSLDNDDHQIRKKQEDIEVHHLSSNWSKEMVTTGDDGTIPTWVDANKRKLLEANPTHHRLKPNVTVAKDGSGKYKTIAEALMEIPKNADDHMFIIHVKKGVYKEYLRIERWQTHVLLIGDGPTKTRITGDKNFIEGTPTFKTASLSILADYFMAKDIGFENSAGAEKHQAVALRVQADQAIFYNCHMDGYQDTLYAHTYRQFYRDCRISGTIDFVFGDASSFFQNCTFVVRKPMDNQNCIVTAQGRKERRQPSGIILHKCNITADPDYYPLGRPWKQFSKTIIIESYIEDLIQPEGWLPWEGNFALDTCYYGEYNNAGPGASMEGRAKWRGVKMIIPSRAEKLMPPTFFDGDEWIRKTGIPYIPNLTTAPSPESAAMPAGVDEDPNAPAPAPAPAPSSYSSKFSSDKSSSSSSGSKSSSSSSSKSSSHKSASSDLSSSSSGSKSSSSSSSKSSSHKSTSSDSSSSSSGSKSSSSSSSKSSSDRSPSSASSIPSSSSSSFSSAKAYHKFHVIYSSTHTPIASPTPSPSPSSIISPRLVSEMATITTSLSESPLSVINLERELMEDDETIDNSLEDETTSETTTITPMTSPTSSPSPSPASSPGFFTKTARISLPPNESMLSVINRKRTSMEDGGTIEEISELDTIIGMETIPQIASPVSSPSPPQTLSPSCYSKLAGRISSLSKNLPSVVDLERLLMEEEETTDKKNSALDTKVETSTTTVVSPTLSPSSSSMASPASSPSWSPGLSPIPISGMTTTSTSSAERIVTARLFHAGRDSMLSIVNHIETSTEDEEQIEGISKLDAIMETPIIAPTPASSPNLASRSEHDFISSLCPVSAPPKAREGSRPLVKNLERELMAEKGGDVDDDGEDASGNIADGDETSTVPVAVGPPTSAPSRSKETAQYGEPTMAPSPDMAPRKKDNDPAQDKPTTANSEPLEDSGSNPVCMVRIMLSVLAVRAAFGL